MKINKIVMTSVLLLGLLVGGFTAGVFLTQPPTLVDAAPPAQTYENDDGAEEYVAPDPSYITQEEAITVAEAVNPGAKVVEVELEKERGQVIYEVEFDNNLEVMIDPVDGTVLGTEQDD